MRRFRELDWLLLFLASWIAPVAYDARFGLQYWSSLLFWLVPVGVLAPRFLFQTDAGGRRRAAFGIAVISITGLGILLDFVFGPRILRFDDVAGRYICRLPVPFSTFTIPIEEVLFYLLGPVAVLLVYVWCDEYFLAAYNQTSRRLRLSPHDSVTRFSPAPLAWAAGLLAIGIAARAHWTPGGSVVPLYYTFLVVVAVAPAIFLFKPIAPLVNWRAFALTTLYLVLTSLVWEAILALPRHWWGYQPDAMVGLWVRSFSPDTEWVLPVEAVLVWFCTPFSVVLAYEGIKARQYARRPAKLPYVPLDAP